MQFLGKTFEASRQLALIYVCMTETLNAEWSAVGFVSGERAKSA